MIAKLESLNYVEAVLWGSIGVGFAIAAVRRAGRSRALCLVAAATFIIFGVTDLIEVRSGAWWRPWWLLGLKATCVAAMLWLLWARRRSAPQA